MTSKSRNFVRSIILLASSQGAEYIMWHMTCAWGNASKYPNTKAHIRANNHQTNGLHNSPSRSKKENQTDCAGMKTWAGKQSSGIPDLKRPSKCDTFPTDILIFNFNSKIMENNAMPATNIMLIVIRSAVITPMKMMDVLDSVALHPFVQVWFAVFGNGVIFEFTNSRRNRFSTSLFFIWHGWNRQSAFINVYHFAVFYIRAKLQNMDHIAIQAWWIAEECECLFDNYIEFKNPIFIWSFLLDDLPSQYYYSRKSHWWAIRDLRDEFEELHQLFSHELPY